MNIEYTRAEIKGLIEANRDGESLEQLEVRIAIEWITKCQSEGKDPLSIIREAAESLRGTIRD